MNMRHEFAPARKTDDSRHPTEEVNKNRHGLEESKTYQSKYAKMKFVETDLCATKHIEVVMVWRTFLRKLSQRNSLN